MPRTLMHCKLCARRALLASRLKSLACGLRLLGSPFQRQQPKVPKVPKPKTSNPSASMQTMANLLALIRTRKLVAPPELALADFALTSSGSLYGLLRGSF